MEFLKYIKDNTLLVVPNTLKQKVLEKLDVLNHFVNVKIMSMDELKRKIYFNYDLDAIIYLMNQYKIKIDVSKTYLENMYFLTSSSTSSSKLNELHRIKSEMFDLGLLKTSPLFPMFLKGKTAIFYGYDFYKLEDMRLIDEVKKYAPVQVLEKEVNPRRDLSVQVFEKVDDEVEYIINKMIYLHEQGISWNKFKIIGLDDTYKSIFSKFLEFFNIPLSLDTKVSLYETLIGKKVLSLHQKGYHFSDILKELDDVDSTIKNKILTIFNKYQRFLTAKASFYPLLEDEFKNVYLEEDGIDTEIKQASITNFFYEDGDYVFVIGFTNGRFPVVKKDEDYISNELKKELGLTTTEEENEMSKNALMNSLFGTQKIVITYSKHDYFNEYYPSTLINDYGMKEVEEEEFLVHYSKTWDKIKLTKMLDDYLKFGIKHKDLEKLYSSVDIDYL